MLLAGGRFGNQKQGSGGGRPGLGGKLFKGVASGIGLASESYHHHKEKKNWKNRAEMPSQTQEQAPASPAYEEQARLAAQADEAAWQLDEAQRELEGRDKTSGQEEPMSDEQLIQMADEFAKKHPMRIKNTNPQSSPRPLDLPVVITQRRPGRRDRGFMRAYAPVLNEVAIDQATFLDFLDHLNKAVQPSPWIEVLNLASLAGHAVPEPFTILVSIAVQQAVKAANEIHSRTKTNSFLDKVNESFFAPRGLIALVMTWKPSQAGQVVTTVNLDEMDSSIATAANRTQETDSFNRFANKFVSSSGSTSFEWPETAPLVFPKLDDLAIASADGEEKKKKANFLKQSGGFVEEYIDRRARAEWADQNPDSATANAAPKEEFHSRYADPSHPASNGDPLALLTGGYLQSPVGRGLDSLGGGLGGGDGLGSRLGSLGARGRLTDRLGYRDIRGGYPSRSQGQDGNEQYTRSGPSMDLRGAGLGGIVGGTGLAGGGIKMARKFFEKDILYLMVVQRPTEEEMARATAYLQRMNH
ncbi:hypothetical protein ASPZODRAFT_13404 [Penicilliopsis zonata CBS 506.65]|uniref:Uncharacterized protein n=1 Tax=Penicilliopsis zonata CBS 506.65 TaxID=1073090 RepID=A0A1L9SSY7_9EURO|nr:hypothetical protein ASPZODRAFT_13404 [Penicilliopsis zonata CBS 506.65]OJJ50318.1 hypothetical protein ASPZODRAFT_13404 [Penicilliopsis zonata CBS 506.65]